jgi:hypothetical protein
LLLVMPASTWVTVCAPICWLTRSPPWRGHVGDLVAQHRGQAGLVA